MVLIVEPTDEDKKAPLRIAWEHEKSFKNMKEKVDDPTLR